MELRLPLRSARPGDPAVVSANGRWIAVFRVEDDVYALEDTCPHMGNPISMGEVRADRTVVCAFHGWRFDLATGSCVAGAAPVAAFPAAIVGDEIVVQLPED